MSDRLELKVLFTAVDKFVRPVKAVTDAARVASKALKANSDRISEFNSTIGKIDAFKRVERDAAITANTIKSTTDKIEALRTEIAKSGVPTKEQSRRLEELQSKSAALAGTSEKLKRQHVDLSAALRQAKVDTANLASARELLSSASADATLNSRRLQAALDAENRKMERMRAAHESFARNQGRIGQLRAAGTRLLAGGLAAGAAGAVPVLAYAKAEDAATQLQIALTRSNGEVESSFQAINDLANRLGNRLPGTTADYQDMMTMLVRQGMTSKAILGGLGEATALLGVQLKMPMEAAAEFAAKLQDATRTTEKDMLGLMDVIQRTFYLGVDQNNMLEAFKGLGPVMDMIKVKGLEGTKALAPFVVMMDQAGMRGESAGNAIRKVVSRSMNRDFINTLLEDMKKFEGFQDKSLKLDFTDGKGEFGGIDKLMAELNKLKKYDTVTRLQLLSRIYGDDKETNEVLSKIIEQGIGGYNEVIAKMQAQADLNTRVDRQLKTLSNLWDAASGTFTNALVAFGESVAPELHATAEWLGKVAAGVQAWARENPNLAAGIMTTVKWTGLLALGLGGVITGLAAIAVPLNIARFALTAFGISGASVVGVLGSAFNVVMKGIGLLGNAFNVVMKGIGLLGNALLWIANLALAHPVLALITAIAAGALYVWKNWDTLGPKFFALIDTISTYFGNLKDRAIEAGRNMIDGMISGITSRWDALKTTVTGIGDKSVDWVKEKLGIHSPSQVFADLGGYTIQGFEKGMLANVDGPLGAISLLSKRLTAIGAGVVISGAAAAGNFAIDTRPAMSGHAGAQYSASGGDTFIFHINAAPGMDEKALARAVRDEFERQRNAEASRRRSRLRDPE